MKLHSIMSPSDMRRRFRSNEIIAPTSGFCPGYTQCNLIILPEALSDGFRKFAELNPFSCPVLEMTGPGERKLTELANDVDIATDLPKYRLYIDGKLAEEPPDIRHLWRNDLVSFLIGCSFSFEEALSEAGIPIRHNEEGCNVPMYITNIDCMPYASFSGKMVVSMRPMLPNQAQVAANITKRMPRVHGAPIHIGDGRAIGIENMANPDFGDTVTIKPGEVGVFWPCGVTPQSIVMNSKPPFAITHAPGHMLICDITNKSLIE